MLVGHSQGGVVAAQAAADSARGTLGYIITHVVTAGSPVALADVPPSVQVLSLENVNNLVPQLDGEPNPASANHTTVRFESDTGTFDNHSHNAAYQAMADQWSEHPDIAPSAEAFMDSAGPFLADPKDQTTATTSIYDLHTEDG